MSKEFHDYYNGSIISNDMHTFGFAGLLFKWIILFYFCLFAYSAVPIESFPPR